MQTQQNDYWEIYEQQEEILSQVLELFQSLFTQNVNLFAKIRKLEKQVQQQEAKANQTIP